MVTHWGCPWHCLGEDCSGLLTVCRWEHPDSPHLSPLRALTARLGQALGGQRASCPPHGTVGIAEMPQIPFFPGFIRGGGEIRVLVRASGRDEEGSGLPPGTCGWVPRFAPRPGPAGSAGDRAQGATGRLSQGHAMTQSCCWWKTTALVCVTALMAPHPPLPAAATAPPPGDARGADTGPRSRRGTDLAVLFQDIQCEPEL